MTEKKSLCDKRQKEKHRINKSKRALTRKLAIDTPTHFKLTKDLYWDFNVGTCDHRV